jgi:hypothetical protein
MPFVTLREESSYEEIAAILRQSIASAGSPSRHDDSICADDLVNGLRAAGLLVPAQRRLHR